MSFVYAGLLHRAAMNQAVRPTRAAGGGRATTGTPRSGRTARRRTAATDQARWSRPARSRHRPSHVQAVSSSWPHGHPQTASANPAASTATGQASQDHRRTHLYHRSAAIRHPVGRPSNGSLASYCPWLVSMPASNRLGLGHHPAKTCRRPMRLGRSSPPGRGRVRLEAAKPRISAVFTARGTAPGSATLRRRWLSRRSGGPGLMPTLGCGTYPVPSQANRGGS